MRYAFYFLPLIIAAQPAADTSKLLEAIHAANVTAVRAALKSGSRVNAADERGSTPLMHAAAYCSVDCMKVLLSAGAKVNAESNAGFTPLMWSVWDPAKVRLLLGEGANVNAQSRDGNTALILARQNMIPETVPMLLGAGAKDEDGMGPESRALLQMDRDVFIQGRAIGIELMHLSREVKPVSLAVYAKGGAVDPLRKLLDAGGDPNAQAAFVTLTLPPVSYAAYGGNAGQVQELLTRGASPNAKGSRGLTPLMLAASPDAPNPEVISLLLGKGAEINAQDELGRTALDWTLLRGDTSAARQLRAAGGKSLAAPTPAPAAVARPLEPAEAIKKALALLEPIGPRFFNTSGGCISCHNNTLPGMAAQKAAERKIAVNRAMLDHAPKAAMAMWRPMEENLAVGASSVPGLVANVSYELMAMAEAGYPPNSTTDAAALSMLRLQRSDGSWTIADTRSPLGISDMKFTAMVARALIAYLPPGLRRERDGAVDRARNYLLKTHAESTQDAAFQVLGLLWVNAGGAAVQESRARLLALQRKDGGWGQLPTMASDAYATGQALFALQATKPAADSEEYRRGVRYLLRTQLPDGSWFVQTRAIAFQPYRETGFPHGTSQFISAAATSWAVMALSPAVDVQARSATQK